MIARTTLVALVLSFAALAQEPAQRQPPVAQTPANAPPLPPPVQAGTAPGAQQLSLEAAIAEAMNTNYDLIRSRLQSRSTEQDYVAARSAILPRLDFNASLSRNRQGAGTTVVAGAGTFERPVQAFTGYNGSLQLRQLVFDGGKWWNNLSAADLGLAASRAAVEEQRLQTTFTVEQRFYELVRAQRQLAVLGDAAARSREQADFVQKLYEGGRSTQADVYAARANRDNDEINRLGQERAVEIARTDLALAIGRDPAEPIAVAEPPRLLDDPAAPPPAQDAVHKALTSRPSLKAFELQAESNRKQAAAAAGDDWPQVSVGASYGRNTSSLADFTDSPDRNSNLSGSINLNWNLFNGFATNAQVTKARVGVQQAENDLQNGRRGVASDVEKAIAQLGTARAQARVATQTEENAREGLRLAKTRQQVGVGTQLEVRDAELKLTQAQLSRVGALVDGREAEAALRRAVGGT